jgi:hypothetical protein
MTSFQDILKGILDEDIEQVYRPDILSVALDKYNKMNNKNLKLTGVLKVQGNNIVKEYTKMADELKETQKKSLMTKSDDEEPLDEDVSEKDLEADEVPEKDLEASVSSAAVSSAAVSSASVSSAAVSSAESTPGVMVKLVRKPRIPLPEFTLYTQGITSERGQIKSGIRAEALRKFHTFAAEANFPEFGVVTADEYVHAFNLSEDVLAELHDLDRITKTIKPQGQKVGTIFHYASAQRSVSYSAIDKKKAPLEPRNEELINVFEKLYKHTMPPCQKFNWKTYLLSRVINSINVIESKVLRISDRYYKIGKLNYFHDYTPDIDDVKNAVAPSRFLSLAYSTLLNTICEVNIQRHELLLRNIFRNRGGITGNNDKLPEATRKSCWCKALGNMEQLDLSLFSPEEREIIQMWQNILRSPYCYYIFLYNVTGSAHFVTAINKLLKPCLSLKLLGTCLYPICFVFTPFMCKTNKRPPTGTGKGCVYKKNISEHYNHIATEKDTPEQCNWIGFLDTGEEENTNLCLLHDWLATVKDPAVRHFQPKLAIKK